MRTLPHCWKYLADRPYPADMAEADKPAHLLKLFNKVFEEDRKANQDDLKEVLGISEPEQQS